LKETSPAERRVALVPQALPVLAKAGIELVVESGAGAAAGFPDAAFEARGARVLKTRAEVLSTARVPVQVRPLDGPSAGTAREGLGREHVLVGMLDPLGAPARIQELAAGGVTAFALELLPRITRAQAMDVLSSAATVTGYKAVLLAAVAL